MYLLNPKQAYFDRNYTLFNNSFKNKPTFLDMETFSFVNANKYLKNVKKTLKSLHKHNRIIIILITIMVMIIMIILHTMHSDEITQLPQNHH